MAELTVQEITRSGLNVSMSAADAAGDNFHQRPDDRAFFMVENGASSSVEVTVSAEHTSKVVPSWGELSASDAVVSIPAGETHLIGPFPQSVYTADPSITYDDETDVSVAAVRLTRS